MKYIEHIKSITLTLLVFFSISLTFSIWTYTPNYDLIEQSPVQDVTIGAKKAVADVLKPYKMLYRFNEEWKGTVSASAIDDTMLMLKQWRATDLRQVDTHLSANQVNDMMRKENRMTIFFMGAIPFQTFREVLPFEDQELPEDSFDRIVVDWKEYQSKKLNIYFINTEKGYAYRAVVQLTNGLHFQESVLKPAKEYGRYNEIVRENKMSLYVIDEPVEAIKYTYYIDEIQPDLFKDVLFANPNLVQRNADGMQPEKYTDGMSLMTVDTSNKTLHYVYPAAESNTPIVPSKLLQNSFDFINEHGGFTDDYRYASMNTATHQIEYELFLEGLPVVSYETLTHLSTTWGDNRIFRYKRPYFSLDMDITSEKELKALPSGEKVLEWLKTADVNMLSEISEVIVGYTLSKAENQNLYTLEPSWFYVRNGSWVRITPEMLGGAS